MSNCPKCGQSNNQTVHVCPSEMRTGIYFAPAECGLSGELPPWKEMLALLRRIAEAVEAIKKEAR